MLNAGASGYVLKNINKEILLEAINTIVKGGTYFSSEIPIALAASSAEDIITHEKQISSPKESSRTISLLSPREIEILKLIANGLSNNEIAKKLFISPNTVDTHRTNLMQKLNIHNVVGLMKYAIKNGLLE
jgi:DNA-binding NarL/FixJ family response regulator